MIPEKWFAPLLSSNSLSGPTYRVASGSIGKALTLWAFAIQVFSDDEVKFKPEQICALSFFIDADQALLLRNLILRKAYQ
eukprot:scaffold1150_cov152-Amphora_coffeaeformis.AAC.12